jgi:hypothetical protein
VSCVGTLKAKVNGSWEAVSGSSASTVVTGPPPVRRAFSTVGSSTWTKPVGLSYVEVEVQAGGGGGGGAGTAAANQHTNGGGGGGGGSIKCIFLASQLGATEAVVVGAGGTAGTVAGGAGGAGGNTTFSSGANLLTAAGGLGGEGSVSDPSSYGMAGGAGGTTTGPTGSVPSFGQPGDGSFGSGGFATSGSGGGSQFGAGGVGRALGTYGYALPGFAGGGYGGGGSGGMCSSSSGTGALGGAGAPGIVYVTEYYAAGAGTAEIESWRAVSTANMTYNTNVWTDVTGCSVTVPVTASTDKFLVVSNADCEIYGGGLGFVSLWVAGIRQSGDMLIQGATNSRSTVGQNWIITGLAPGNNIFKLAGMNYTNTGSASVYTGTQFSVVKLASNSSVGSVSAATQAGAISMWSKATPPVGWMLCNGGTFSSTVYPELAANLGDTYGVHSGTTYYLPDMDVGGVAPGTSIARVVGEPSLNGAGPYSATVPGPTAGASFSVPAGGTLIGTINATHYASTAIDLNLEAYVDGVSVGTLTLKTAHPGVNAHVPIAALVFSTTVAAGTHYFYLRNAGGQGDAGDRWSLNSRIYTTEKTVNYIVKTATDPAGPGSALVTTSTARPAAPTTGLQVYETDTTNSMVWDGTTWKSVGAPPVDTGGGMKTYRDVHQNVLWNNASTPGWVVVQTKLPLTAGIMIRFDVDLRGGYYSANYSGTANLYLYNTGGGQVFGPGWISRGNANLNCYFAKDASNNLVLLFNQSTQASVGVAGSWNYGTTIRISNLQVSLGSNLVQDSWLAGWISGIQSSIATWSASAVYPETDDTTWVTPTLLSPFSQYDVANWAAQYRKLKGIVYLKGLIKSSGTPNGTYFALPAGCRPAQNLIFNTANGAGTNSMIYVYGGDGTVVCSMGGSAAWTSLSGITFPADL